MKTPIPPFIVELIQRVLNDNPSFFKWIQAISGVIATIAFLPDLLAYLEIQSPDWLTLLNNWAVKLSALTAIIMAQLPNKSANDKVA